MKKALIVSMFGLLSIVTSTTQARDSVCTTMDQPVVYPNVTGATIRVTVCRDKNLTAGEQKAFIFTHGSTARGRQLDSEFQAQNYSIAEKLTQLGWLVVYYDRVGTGDSTVPVDSALVTVDATVGVMHQLTQAVRNDTLVGGVLGHNVSRVACSGASLGTGYTWEQAAQYPGDCDALVTWGAAHDTPQEFVYNLYPNHFFPAKDDPVIDNPNLFWDPTRYNPLVQANVGMGYVTTTPMQDPQPGGPAPYNTEWRQFYFLPVDALLSNPYLVTVEELNKSFVSSELVGESASRHALFQVPCGQQGESVSCGIPTTVPVVMLYGAHDRAVCGQPAFTSPGMACSSETEVETTEAPFFNTSFEAIEVLDAAHEIQFGSNIHSALERVDQTLATHWTL